MRQSIREEARQAAEELLAARAASAGGSRRGGLFDQRSSRQPHRHRFQP